MDNNKPKIPCTIAILTKNSVGTLEEALKSASSFSEILVCDGYSDDGTRELAAKYGAKIINQSREFINKEGSLIDYSGVRNQMLSASSNDWQFYLDSDELLTDEIVDEIADVVSADNKSPYKVYLVPRKYVYKNRVVEKAITYPAYQYRFFNRLFVHKFTKPIHERIRFDSSVAVGKLQQFQLVPMRNSAASLWSGKMQKYIEMEIDPHRHKTSLEHIPAFLELSKRIIVLFVRLLTKRFLRRGYKLPLPYDLMVIRYQWCILIGILRLRKKIIYGE